MNLHHNCQKSKSIHELKGTSGSPQIRISWMVEGLSLAHQRSGF